MLCHCCLYKSQTRGTSLGFLPFGNLLIMCIGDTQYNNVSGSKFTAAVRYNIMHMCVLCACVYNRHMHTYTQIRHAKSIATHMCV